MPQRIDVPGTGVVEFPDGMTDEAISAAIKTHLADQPSTAMDIAKSGGVGLGKGLIHGVGAAGDVRGLADRGADYLADKAGISPDTVQSVKDVVSRGLKMTPLAPLAQGPSSEDIQKKIEDVTGEFHKPETRAGRYAESIGETLGNPASYVGPGGLPFKLATGVTSAVGGELGDEVGGTKGRIAGALLGSAAPSLARGMVTPVTTSPRQAELVKTLEDSGVTSLTAGQRTGSPVLQSLENKIGNTPGTGFAADRIADEGVRQFTQSVMGDMGQPGMATKVNLQAAKDRIGDVFNDLSARNTLSTDAKVATDLIKTSTRYEAVLDANQKPIFNKLLSDITDKLAAGGMTGEEYQIARSQLGGKARGLQITDPESAKAFKGMQKALDDAMERGLSDADKAAWRKARDEYGRLKDVEGAVPKDGPALVEGAIDPAALNRSISSGKDASAAARGQLPYSDIAEAGAGVMVPPQRVPLSSPSLSGLTLGAPSAAIGRLLMSRPGQAYAGNQIFSTPMPGGSNAYAIARALLNQGAQ